MPKSIININDLVLTLGPKNGDNYLSYDITKLDKP